MKLLDLFSGIGGFSLAAHRAGFEVVAHCEIENFPRAVLRHRFPNIPIFEDVKTLTKESFYERTGQSTVDIVCGGSPCQDLSIAGKQRGVVGGTRSALFYEQIRIAKELGAKFIVWENVPGALSSNKGKDFERILCGFTGHDSIDFDKWGTAGVFRARTESDYSVCYRVLDTRFFGIPQRRRRIYLVASLGMQPRPEVLFEREGVCGNSTQSRAQGEDVATFAEGSFGTFRKDCISGTLKESGGCLSGGSKTLVCTDSTSLKEESPTLQACLCKQHNKQNPIVLFENHRRDARYEQKSISPTLSAMMGTGGNNQPLCVAFSHKDNGRDVHVGFSPPLRAMGAVNGNNSGGGNIAVCIAENIINRKDENGGNGIGAQENISYTLNATGVHGVVNNLAVRRLTPIECERLQGFPDGWTFFCNAKGKPCGDSPRYKACGNAITVGVGEWVLKRLSYYA